MLNSWKLLSLCVFLFQAFDFQTVYLNETYNGVTTNGSFAFPYINLSQVLAISSSNYVDLEAFSDFHCNITLFNNFGLALRFFVLFLKKQTYNIFYFYFRGANIDSLVKMFMYEGCNIISSNSSLIFQNISIIFVKTTATESPFKIMNKGFLSIEVRK